MLGSLAEADDAIQSLRPAERLAFVLHDMFAVPFEQIAAIDILSDPGRIARLDLAGHDGEV
jgi:hypothetical protein